MYEDEPASSTVMLEEAKTVEEQIVEFKEEMAKSGYFQKKKNKDGSVTFYTRDSKTGKLEPVDDDTLFEILKK